MANEPFDRGFVRGSGKQDREPIADIGNLLNQIGGKPDQRGKRKAGGSRYLKRRAERVGCSYGGYSHCDLIGVCKLRQSLELLLRNRSPLPTLQDRLC